MNEGEHSTTAAEALAACAHTSAAASRLLDAAHAAVLLPGGVAPEPLREPLERVAAGGGPRAEGAFAGVPLPGVDGAALGVAAEGERSYGDRELAILEELAASLARELALHDALHERAGTAEALELERHLIETLLEHSPDQLYFKDRDCRYVRASRAVSDRFRLADPAELVGKSDLDFFSVEHARSALADEQQLLATGVPIVGVEEREIWPDGRETWVSSTKVPVRDGEGRIVGLFGVSRDVTARKRSEEALRESERQLRLLLEQLPAIVWTTDSELRVISAAGAGLAGLGLTSASPEIQELLTLLRRAEGELGAEEAHRRALAGESVGYRARAGALFFECHAEPLRSTDGEITGAIGVAVDVSERRQADEALRSSEARKSAIFESALDWVITVDGDSRIVEVNPSGEQALEWERGKLVGCVLADVLPDVAQPGVELPLGRRFETRARRSDGSALPVEVAISRVELPGHELLTVVVRDIADRKRAEEEVRAADAKYRTLVEELPLATYITVLGDQLDALYVSPQILQLTGYTPEEWLGEPGFAASAVHPDDLERVLDEVTRAEQSTERLRTEYRLRHKEGRTVWVLDETVVVRDSFDTPLFRQGILLDITDRKHLEEQLTQSQRMEAVGKLAGGIAHDFNNLLTAITGYSDLLLLSLPSGDPLRLDADQIKKAADRAAGLTRQLLAFSRRQVLQPQVIELNEVIRGVEEMTRRLIGEHIEPIIVLSPDIGTLKADPGQLEQVLVNLAVNARDAMPDGGKLVIETRNVVLDEAYAAEHVEVTPGRYVLLAVTDTGTGMDAETRARAFEPFFTTKEPGKGTGLGLATVYGIVKQSGGHVSVYSELGHGSTFKVYLPRIDEDISAAEGDADGGAREGSETILLVEDETVVRQLVSKVLSRNGYRVLEACQGNEALDICRSFSGPIDLMLTDVVMPGMSGSELAERISQLRPAVKVIHMSGYTDEAIRHHGVLGRGKAFLPKPFTMETLARTVREVLDG